MSRPEKPVSRRDLIRTAASTVVVSGGALMSGPVSAQTDRYGMTRDELASVLQTNTRFWEGVAGLAKDGKLTMDGDFWDFLIRDMQAVRRLIDWGQ